MTCSTRVPKVTAGSWKFSNDMLQSEQYHMGKKKSYTHELIRSSTDTHTHIIIPYLFCDTYFYLKEKKKNRIGSV